MACLKHYCMAPHDKDYHSILNTDNLVPSPATDWNTTSMILSQSVHSIYVATEDTNHLCCPNMTIQQWNRKQKNQQKSQLLASYEHK